MKSRIIPRRMTHKIINNFEILEDVIEVWYMLVKKVKICHEILSELDFGSNQSRGSIR